MNLDDPFYFYPGDFTLINAVSLELMVRKLLQENGFEQRSFGIHVDMKGALAGNGQHYLWDNLSQAIDFVVEALTFMKCKVRWLGEGYDSVIAVKLPEGVDCSKYDSSELLNSLSYGRGRYDSFYLIKLGKRNTVFYLFDENYGYDWRCLVDIVEGIMKLCKGGLWLGNSNHAA